jgi:hypothetical protein
MHGGRPMERGIGYGKFNHWILQSAQLQVSQQPLPKIIDPAMDHDRAIAAPCLFNHVGFAHRVDLSHYVQLAQAMPARGFVGRGIQLVFVSAINSLT